MILSLRTPTLLSLRLRASSVAWKVAGLLVVRLPWVVQKGVVTMLDILNRD